MYCKICAHVSGFISIGEAARLRDFLRSYVLELVRQSRFHYEVLFGRVLVRQSNMEGGQGGKVGA